MSERMWETSDVKRLKAALAQAKAEKKEVFKFDGHDVLVSHVVALIPIIEERLKKRR